jgi:hypothetical protein
VFALIGQSWSMSNENVSAFAAPFYSHQGVNNISQSTRHNTCQQQDNTRCHSCCDIKDQLTQRVLALEQAEEASQNKVILLSILTNFKALSRI